MKLFAFLLLLSALIIACGPKPESRETTSASTAEKAVSPQDADAAEPALTSDNEGNFYLAYVRHRTKADSDVMFQRLAADGSPDGDAVRVNPEAGKARSWYGDPPTVKTGPDGAVYVGWTDSRTDLFLSVSRDGGTSFEAPVKVNDDVKPASHGMHSLALGANGEIYMAWLDERNVKTEHAFNSSPEPAGYYIVKAHHTDPKPKAAAPQEAAEPNSEVFFAVSTDGGRSFSPNKRLAADVCPCCKTSMAVAPDGRLYVSWRQVVGDNMRHIAVASTDDAGRTFSPHTIVSDDQWQIYACPVSGAALAAGENGFLRVVWYTAGKAGQPGLYSAESNDAGKTFSPRELISAEAISGTPNLLGPDKNSSIIFPEDGKAAAKVPTAPLQTTEFPDAALPSAAANGTGAMIAFVRTTAGIRSILVAKARG